MSLIEFKKLSLIKSETGNSAKITMLMTALVSVKGCFSGRVNDMAAVLTEILMSAEMTIA